MNCFFWVMTGLLIFSIYVSFSNQWAIHAQAPQQPLFSQLLTVQEVAQSPFGTFSKNRSPYPRLALPQGFGPSSRLSIFSSIAFSGYFNPATLFLFHLRCSLWPRPSFILRLGTFWTPPAFAWWWGRAGLPTVGAAGAAALLVLPFLKAFCLPFFKAFCMPFPKAFCLPFPKATPLIPGWSWQRNMGSIPENWTAWI